MEEPLPFEAITERFQQLPSGPTLEERIVACILGVGR